VNVLRILLVWFCVAVLGVVVVGGIYVMSVRAAYNARYERATCTIHIRNVQQAVRSYAELNHLKPGDALDQSALKGYLGKEPECPKGGFYIYMDNVPALGVLYCRCSEKCGPDNYEGW